MRIKITKTNSNTNYYIIKDFNINGKRTTKIMEKLGNEDDIKNRFNCNDISKTLNAYVNKLNIDDQKSKNNIIKFFDSSKLIDINNQILFNAGYLFLQSVYYKLDINNICSSISDKYQFKFDLNNILSNLIYSRIIYPSSKLRSFELSKNFIEQPNYELHDIYRALEVISKESDFIQSELYKNSLKYSKRNDSIVYYDCTNFFFELEQEDGLKQYGKSKESRPNPIVQMGLFMDGDGIPLAMDITPGNTNEQTTLKPLEQKIISDFNNSKFIVCTDAGLASNTNRKFNDTNERKFITTQSLKKIKAFIKDWALDLTEGWKLNESTKTYNIESLRNNDELIDKYYDSIFYKERWIKENGIEQRIIVTYSVKYQEYQKRIRNNQIERANKLINTNPSKIGKAKQNDFKRFINNIQTTEDGIVAEENNFTLNNELIEEESKYDGLYSVCTNLEDNVEEIIKVNKRRWEIEESFRIMKTEFKSRPVYLSRNDRIKAHFLTCFLALTIFRYLEKKLDNEYTIEEIINTLKSMNLYQKDNDFIPVYKRTNITDLLHEKFEFRTDYEIINYQKIKKIYNSTKK